MWYSFLLRSSMRYVPAVKMILKFASQKRSRVGAGSTGCFLFAGVIALAIGAVSATAASFQTNSVEGWRVLIDERLLRKDEAATEKALELLRVQLQEIVRVVPARAV